MGFSFVQHSQAWFCVSLVTSALTSFLLMATEMWANVTLTAGKCQFNISVSPPESRVSYNKPFCRMHSHKHIVAHTHTPGHQFTKQDFSCHRARDSLVLTFVLSPNPVFKKEKGPRGAGENILKAGMCSLRLKNIHQSNKKRHPGDTHTHTHPATLCLLSHNKHCKKTMNSNCCPQQISTFEARYWDMCVCVSCLISKYERNRVSRGPCSVLIQCCETHMACLNKRFNVWNCIIFLQAN